MGKPHRMWYNQHIYRYRCDGCQKAFQTEKALMQHNRDKTTHTVTHKARTRRPRGAGRTKSGLYTCSQCPRSFGSDGSLRQHYAAKHSAVLADLPPESFLRQSYTGTGHLNKFSKEKLEPTEEFTEECGRNVNMLARFLQTECKDFSVAEVLVGGSLKKGTAVKGMADLDVSVFLNDFRNMDDYLRNISRVINALKSVVENKPSENWEVDGRTRHALKIKLRRKIRDDFLDVDILPAYNNVAKHRGNLHGLYDEMGRRDSNVIKFYGSSLAPLQLEFVRDRIKDNPNVKNLIRLLKYWKKTHFSSPEKSESGKPKRFPTSYVFELLTIGRWENAGKPVSFNMEKAFKDIMLQLANNRSLNLQWSDYYKTADFSKAAKKTADRPYILDPANPFNNVCDRFDAWDDVTKMAELSANSPLLQSIVCSSNWQ